jgi:hypothetical protein
MEMRVNLNEEISDLRIAVPRGMIYTMAGVGWFPHEEIEELMPDIIRLMKALASGCTDASNVSLHFDELLGELHTKLAQILRNRCVSYASREKFFGFLKVSFQRHLKSTVQKYALTYKRTGVKPKKKSDETPVSFDEDPTENHIPQVALDDEEGGAENFVGEADEGFAALELSDEIQHFISEHLTKDEKAVFYQEAEPNSRALKLAFGATPRNRKSRKFRILDRHKAEGIRMPLFAYKRNLDQIRAKLLEFWKFEGTPRYERNLTTTNA